MFNLDAHPKLQKEFFNLLLEVMEYHSVKSKESFLKTIKKLQLREEIVKVYSIDHKILEIGLVWYRTDEYGDAIEDQPFMAGAMIYHKHSDEWGVHT